MNPVRFFDPGFTGAQREKILRDRLIYLNIESTLEPDQTLLNQAIFFNRKFADVPAGIAFDENSFKVYVNGISILPDHVLVEEKVDGVYVTFYPNLIGYDINPTDEVVLTGKFK